MEVANEMIQGVEWGVFMLFLCLSGPSQEHKEAETVDDLFIRGIEFLNNNESNAADG
jgi:hypothetical protein